MSCVIANVAVSRPWYGCCRQHSCFVTQWYGCYGQHSCCVMQWYGCYGQHSCCVSLWCCSVPLCHAMVRLLRTTQLLPKHDVVVSHSILLENVKQAISSSARRFSGHQQHVCTHAIAVQVLLVWPVVRTVSTGTGRRSWSHIFTLPRCRFSCQNHKAPKLICMYFMIV